MSGKKKILFLFTDSFPFGYNETYILSEQRVIHTNFEKIYYFPLNCNNEGDNRFDIPNAQIIDIHKKYTDKNVNVFSFLKIFLFEIFKTNNKSIYFSKKVLQILYNAIYYSNRIKQFIADEKLNEDDILFYSYWNYHWSLVLAVLKNSKPIIKVITRAHLHDLYDYLTFNFYANYKYKMLDNVYCISEHGRKYLENNYIKYSNKFKVAYLGTSNDFNLKQISPTDNNTFTIVSCSAVRKEKRVDKIIDILKQVKYPVNWYHFGGGVLFESLKEKSKTLPANINCHLSGNIKNFRILDFYSKNDIDLFVNVSSEEGIPFSLMEVISYGVPIMACDVFGNKEICTSKTGILIEKDFDPKVVANNIETFLTEKNIKKEEVQNFWKENFNAEKNFTAFVNQL
ncbi:MAG: glycosyltransferase [Bacteroidota bacterium]